MENVHGALKISSSRAKIVVHLVVQKDILTEKPNFSTIVYPAKAGPDVREIIIQSTN